MKHEDRSHGAGAPVRYRLSCGHATDAWGQTDGLPAKARCHICGDLAMLLHILSRGVIA